MMSKVLAQAGISLADAYDVEGSRAGVETLLPGEVQLVHEMGATLFSERFNGQVHRVSTGALLQSASWDIELTALPETPTRILGIQVIADVAVRTNMASVMARDPGVNREFPLWVWDDDTPDLFVQCRMRDEGAAAVVEMLVPLRPPQIQAPSMIMGIDNRDGVRDIAFRGQTSAFGAGNVTHTMLLFLANARLGGVSSIGLPIPSW